MPEPLELLRVRLQRVERLGHPHRRRCWRAATGWQEEWLNPQTCMAAPASHD